MKSITAIILLTLSMTASAWTGEDINSGELVFISGSEHLNYGDQVTFKKGDAGSYKDGVILSKFNYGDDFQLEVREERFGDVSVIKILQ
jgi:hypothetical protein